MISTPSAKRDQEAAPVAIVMKMGATGLGVVRSLGRAGIRAIGIDSDARAVGFTSRHCRGRHVLPDPSQAPEQLCARLETLAAAHSERPVLMPTADVYVGFLSRYRERLRERFRFNLPPADVVENLVDKRRQYALASTLGLPVPRTWSPATREDLGQLQDPALYPLFLKGAASAAWMAAFGEKGFLTRDPAELTRRVEEAWSRGMDVVVQEFIPGPNRNHYKVCGYYDPSGRLLGLFTTQKTRQHPADFGVGSYMTSVRSPELAELGRRFLEGIRYTGVGSIEFKRDERDGQLKLIELNPRFWQQSFQATCAGINFARLNYLDCLGAALEPTLDFQEGVVWLDLRQDARSFRANRRTGVVSLGGWLRSLTKASCFAYFALDDPLPGLAQALRSS